MYSKKSSKTGVVTEIRGNETEQARELRRTSNSKRKAEKQSIDHILQQILSGKPLTPDDLPEVPPFNLSHNKFHVITTISAGLNNETGSDIFVI